MNARLQMGRIFYAIGMIAFGVQHLMYGAFITRVVPQLPAWIPGQKALAYLFGIVLVIAGGAILAQIRVREAALTLAAITAASTVLLYAPKLLANPYQAPLITQMFKAVAFCGGALVLLMSATPGASRSGGTIDRVLPIGRYLFASFLIVGGVQHFMYPTFVATLVPAWVPPSQLFWTYFAGTALIAGGTGIIVPLTTQLAATLAGTMILLWVPMLHIPRALADLHNTNETTAVFEALAMSGIAFMIAGVAARRRDYG